MKKEELFLYIKKNMFNKNGQWKSTAHFKHIEEELIKFQKDGDSFAEKLYLFYHDKPKPVCKTCGNPTKFIKLSQGFREYCSTKCSSNSKEKQEKTKNTVNEKYGVDYITQTDEHKHSVKLKYLNKLKNSSYNNEIVEKRKKTVRKKYGVDNVMHTKVFKNKVLKLKKEKYVEKIIKQFDDILQPLFDINSFNGKSNPNRWKCKLCGSEIIDHLDNYRTPRCYKCFPIHRPISKLEKEVIDYIKSLNIENITENDKSIIKTKELDIYIPSKKLAIEFNGLYWHSELQGKDKNYHLNKTIECEKNDVSLLHIFEDEWINKQNIVKSIISNKVGFANKIYARNCIIKKIENKDCKEFLNENHLQGYIPAKINLALYYENELISLLTFNKPRFNKNYNWEILRFVNKSGLSIIGGFAKLLKHFKQNHEGSIITYSDRRIFDGNIYENNGFKKLSSSKPNYFYTDYNKRYNRQQFQKHKLKDKLKTFDRNLTEWENMQLNGWDRIWDCGNNVFVLD